MQLVPYNYIVLGVSRYEEGQVLALLCLRHIYLSSSGRVRVHIMPCGQINGCCCPVRRNPDVRTRHEYTCHQYDEAYTPEGLAPVL
jgi:hypothetical protein